VDVAQRELQKLQQLKDDAIVTQLGTAWVNIALGKEKLKEAIDTYQELIDKLGPSIALLNGIAVASMQQGAFDKAEKALRDALVLDNKDAVTNINLYVVLEHQLKAPEVLKRQLSVIKSIQPDHPWLISLQRSEDGFDAAMAKVEAELKAQPAT